MSLMPPDASEAVAGIITGFVIGCIVCFCVSSGFCNAVWKASAIERGFAEYHQVTGEWQWKESKAESPDA